MTSKLTTWIARGLLLVSPIGFLDATYLTLKHYAGQTVGCTITQGCEIVTTSSYSVFYGIPVALFGVLYYLLIVLLMIAYVDRKQENVIRLACWITPVGFVASLYFVGIQAFVLQAWCQYCIGSAITSTLLFLLGMTYLATHKRSN